jgi:acetyl-CoA C-acetyltransferase
VDAFDLYACFPSSVEVARDSIGLTSDDPRPITLTGGLPYHGGPGSNYVTHAIVNTLQWLREGKGDAVMVHGNGYYLTKHSVGVYSRRPPAVEPRPPEKLQERIDEESTELPVEPSAEGTGEVVAYTAPFDRDGQPGAALVLAELDGRRTVARADIPLTTQLLHSDAVGASVVVVHDDTGNLARPA